MNKNILMVSLVAALTLGFAYYFNEAEFQTSRVSSLEQQVESLRAEREVLEDGLERARSMIIVDQTGQVGSRLVFEAPNYKQLDENIYQIPGWGLLLEDPQTGDMVILEVFRGETITLLSFEEDTLRYEVCDSPDNCRVRNGVAEVLHLDRG